MFTLARNLYKYLHNRHESEHKQLKFVMLGLDNAGKSTTLAALKGESQNLITPTWGFSQSKIIISHDGSTMSSMKNPHRKKQDTFLAVYDLGGAINFRNVWQHYLAEVHGIIFVVDSSDLDRFDESRIALRHIMDHEYACGKPTLILANKQDKNGALSEDDVRIELNLTKKKGIELRTCAALISDYLKDGIDKAIPNGIQWLVDEVNAQYIPLCKRMYRDLNDQNNIKKKERVARLARIANAKAERRKQVEKNYNSTSTATDDDNEDEDDDDDDDDAVLSTERVDSMKKEDQKHRAILPSSSDSTEDVVIKERWQQKRVRKMKRVRRPSHESVMCDASSENDDHNEISNDVGKEPGLLFGVANPSPIKHTRDSAALSSNCDDDNSCNENESESTRYVVKSIDIVEDNNSGQLLKRNQLRSPSKKRKGRRKKNDMKDNVVPSSKIISNNYNDDSTGGIENQNRNPRELRRLRIAADRKRDSTLAPLGSIDYSTSEIGLSVVTRNLNSGLMEPSSGSGGSSHMLPPLVLPLQRTALSAL